MITLVHGQDNLSSRKFFMSQKDNDSLTFDAETLNPMQLSQSLQGGGLFENPKKIFIESLFTRKGNKNLTAVSEILSANEKAEVFIYADKDVGVRSLSNFPKFTNENFKFPQNIWSFLDGIRPNNPNNIRAFHGALVGSEPEIVFAMIIRQFRLLIGINSTGKNIDEVKKLADWQKSKLRKQASLFELTKLIEIYKKLYKIEKDTKTGSTSLNLVQNIDILLLEI